MGLGIKIGLDLVTAACVGIKVKIGLILFDINQRTFYGIELYLIRKDY